MIFFSGCTPTHSERATDVPDDGPDVPVAVRGDGSPGNPGAIQESVGEKGDGPLLLKPITTANEETSLQIPDPSTSDEPERTGIDNPSVRKT